MDEDYEDDSPLPPPRAPPQNNGTRVCYFYKAGDNNKPAIRLPISNKIYGKMDGLYHDLTKRMDDLPFGVRSITTPAGKHGIFSLEQLEPDKKYLCAESKSKARPVDMNKVPDKKKSFTVGLRAPSGRAKDKELFKPVGAQALAVSKLKRGRNSQNGLSTIPSQSPTKSVNSSHLPLTPRTPKNVMFYRNGKMNVQCKQLLNLGAHGLTFERVMEDLDTFFRMTVKKLYTLDGQPIRSLSAIKNGPDQYVVCGDEPFKEVKAVPKNPPSDKKSLTAAPSNKRPPQRQPTKGKWKVFLTTGEIPTAGTTAQATITVYGQKGNSGPLPLGYADGETLQAGQTDEFMINVGNIGEIYKIRLAHDNSGNYPDWFCDTVHMEDVHSGEELDYTINRWLSREEDDMDICREAPAVRYRQPVLPVLIYEITVLTGDLWNAGTDANVFITIYGERGDTGVRQLLNSKMPEKFRKGQIDKFILEAVSLGKPKKVIVGHDGAGPGYGWYLEKISLKEHATSSKVFVFPCDSWLDEGEGKLVRELKLEQEYKQDIIDKQLFEYEKWKFQPDCQVVLYSVYTNVPLRINRDGSIDANGDFKDPCGVFTVGLRRGLVRVFKNNAFPAFHPVIDNNKVMGKGRGGAYCEFKVRVQKDRSIMFESTKYTGQHIYITHSGRPGDPLDPDQDGRKFFVYCKGMFRNKGIIMLCTSMTQTLNIDHDHTLYATGKRNRLCQLRVIKVAEGNIRKFESVVYPKKYIQLKDGKCDLNGDGDKYCHFRVDRNPEKGYVSLESVVSRGFYIGMTPDGRVIPTVETGATNTWFYPEVIEFGISKKTKQPEPSPEPEEVPVPIQTKPKKHVKKERTPSPPPREPTPEPEAEVEPQPQKPLSPESKFEEGDWKVVINTLEGAHYGEIMLVVYGNKDVSRNILGMAGGELFMSGNQDEFKVNLLKIGTMYKIRLELLPFPDEGEDETKIPSWKVKSVTMKNMSTKKKETFKFNFKRWLSRKEDDLDIARELPAIKAGVNKDEVPPVVWYELRIYTGTEPGADTEADVYCQLIGERGDTGKRGLVISNNEDMFEAGQMDICYIEAVTLGKVTHCVIGHNGQDPGEGWYIDKVVVCVRYDNPHTKSPNPELSEDDEVYYFPCKKWLDSDVGDGKIQRSLKAQDLIKEEEPKPKAKPKKEDPKPKEGDYNVWVTTGPKSIMSLQSQNTAYLVAYGTKGKSDTLTLGQGGQFFVNNKTDQFKVNVGDIGDLYKIRISHEKDDPEIVENSAWFVDKVKMKNLVKGDEFNFKVNRWLSRKHEDKDLNRELPVVRPGKKTLPVVVYVIEIYTGDEPGSDTEANLYIELYGTDNRGDSGRRALYKCTNGNKQMFQPGQCDVFEVEAVTLNDITKVIIGHDADAAGAGWKLDHMIIKEKKEEKPDAKNKSKLPEPKARGRGKNDSPNKKGPKDEEKKEEDKMWYFGSYWFDDSMDDHKIERELFPENPPKTPEPEPEPEPEPVVEEEPPKEKQQRKVWVKTADDSMSANDASVTLKVYGEEGFTDDIVLSRSGAFERDQLDEFELDIEKIGKPYKVRVSREDGDGWEEGGWHLEELRINDPDDEEKMYVFKVDRWMDRSQDDMDIVRELPVVIEGEDTLPVEEYELCVHTGDHWAAETDANVYVIIYGSKGDSGKRRLYHSTNNDTKFRRNQVDIFNIEAVTLHDLERIEVWHDGKGHGAGWFLDKVVIKKASEEGMEYVFSCQRWLDDHEDDRKTHREIRISDVRDVFQPPPGKNDEATVGDWTVTVKTSDIHNAGTLAKVYITVYGIKGVSEKLKLGNAGPKSEDFAQNKQSEFDVNVGDIGEICKVRVEHDNTNAFPDWHLEKIMMKDKHTEEEIVFYVNRWLGLKQEGGLLLRELPVTLGGQPTSPVLRYQVAIATGSIAKAGTKAEIFINMIGENGRDTGLRKLDKSKTCKKPWQPGQVDVFIIEAVHLGHIEKVILQHDNNGLEEMAWFLDKVIVKETEAAIMEQMFECDQWIEPAKRGTTIKELTSSETRFATGIPPYLDAEEEPESEGQWTVWVTTGDEKDGKASGGDEKQTDQPNQDQAEQTNQEGEQNPEEPKPMNGKVFITVCGSKGISDPIPLLTEGEAGAEEAGEEENKENKDNKEEKETKDKEQEDDQEKTDKEKEDAEEKEEEKMFQPGATNEFKIKIPTDIGEIYKIRVHVQRPDEETKEDDTQEGMAEENKESKNNADKDKSGQEKEDKNEADDEKEGKDNEPEPQWALKMLKMKDDITGQEFHFFHEGTVGVTEDNAEGMVELPVVRPDIPPLKEHKFQVAVMTGEQPRADTKAEVYCTLVGCYGDTGRKALKKSNNQELFQKGQLDIFELKALDIGSIEKVIMGHSSLGRGTGWYCNQVNVKVGEDADIAYIFECNRWFDSGTEDRLIERELVSKSVVKVNLPSEEEDEENVLETQGRWTCRVTIATESEMPKPETDEAETAKKEKDGEESVSPEKKAGTKSRKSGTQDKKDRRRSSVQSNKYGGAGKAKQDQGRALEPQEEEPKTKLLYFTAYGEDGVFGPQEFSKEKEEAFAAGETEEFEIEIGEIGEIYKIMVENKLGDLWTVKEVLLQDIDTKDILTFDFAAHLGEKKIDTCRQIPALRPGKQIIPTIKYQVTVHTASNESDENEADEKKSDEQENSITDGENNRGKKDKKEDTEKNRNKRDKNKKDNKAEADEGKNVKNKKGKKEERVEEAEKKVEPEMVEPSLKLNLKGSHGDSGLRSLMTTDETDRLHPGKVATFTVEAVDIGELEGVDLVMNGGPQKAQAWKMEKLTVRAGEFGPVQYTCTYNENVDLSDGKDHSLQLKPTDTTVTPVAIPEEEAEGLPKSEGVWKILVTTGDDETSGATCGVHLVLCGLEGESEQLPLVATSEDQEILKQSQDDEFEVKVSEVIGDIYKVRVCLDERLTPNNWSFKKMEFIEQSTGDTFMLEDGGQIISDECQDGVQEYVAVWPAIKLLPVVKYEVYVHTGDEENAGTEANVYINVEGERGSTGKRWLKHSDNYSKFKPGQVDKFEFESVSVIDCKKVIIGHDGEGEGSGLFVKKVVLNQLTPVEGSIDPEGREEESEEDQEQELPPPPDLKQWIFPCDRWLDEGEDDGAVERELIVSEEEATMWEIFITTGKEEELEEEKEANEGEEETSKGEERAAEKKEKKAAKGEDEEEGQEEGVESTSPPSPPSNVFIVIYGDKGKTEELPLQSEKEILYESGNTDDFKVEVKEDIGEPYKIRFGVTDEPEREITWMLETVKVKIPSKDEELVFDVKGKLIRNNENDGVKEVPVKVEEAENEEEGENDKEEAEEENENEEKKKGKDDQDKGKDKENSESDAKDDAEGEKGEKSKDEEEEENEEDVKTGEKETKKEQLKVYMYRVEVYTGDKSKANTDDKSDGETGDKKSDSGENPESAADNKTDENTNDKNKTNKGDTGDKSKSGTDDPSKAEEETGDQSNNGTEVEVYMEIIGDRGDTGSRKLLKSLEEGKKFKNGKMDLFEIEAVDLLSLTKLKIGQSGLEGEDGWYLEKVIIMDPADDNKKFLFQCDKLLNEEEPNTEVELTKVIEINRKWKVTVYTGDKDGCCMGSVATLTVFGEHGDSGPKVLGEDGQQNFQPGDANEFEVELDVEKITKIRLEHDNSKPEESRWYIEKVTMETEDGEMKLEFPVDRWLAAEEEDGDVVREIPANHPDDDKEPLTVTSYSVELLIGEQSRAEPDAKVYIKLQGENGDSGKRFLHMNKEKTHKFLPGKSDVYTLEAVNLGKLSKVTVGIDQEEDEDKAEDEEDKDQNEDKEKDKTQDDKDKDKDEEKDKEKDDDKDKDKNDDKDEEQKETKGLFLEKIIVKESEDSEEQLEFHCNKWLDKNEDDKKTERELTLEGDEGENGKGDGDNNEEGEDGKKDDDNDNDDDGKEGK